MITDPWTSPLVFIVIVNWNSRGDTAECLKSLEKLDYINFQIVVVDNGSKDGSEDMIRELFPMVHVIQTGRNLGFAGGSNVGISYGLLNGAEYVWLLNNDTIVDPKALSVLVETAVKDPKIGFVGSKIYFYDKPKVIWCVGGTIDLAEGGHTDHPGMSQEDKGQFDEISDVGYVSGCSLLASQNAIAAVGLMPEEYFLYFEETDWNIAIQRKGFRTIMAPASHVWHKYSDKEGYRERFIYYSFRNRIQIVRKYAPRYLLKALIVNLSLMREHIWAHPRKTCLFCFLAFLAHLDAFLPRYGKANWWLIR